MPANRLSDLTHGYDKRPAVHHLAVIPSRFESRSKAALSGGQMQRVLFARLLLQDAEVILLDEPFTAIDARTAADLTVLKHRWHGDGRTVVAVLQDLDAVRRHFPHRMSLTNDAMAHAVLPGAAVGFLVSGRSLSAMTIGGIVTGMAVALLSGFVTRVTALKEDTSMAAF